MGISKSIVRLTRKEENTTFPALSFKRQKEKWQTAEEKAKEIQREKQQQQSRGERMRKSGQRKTKERLSRKD